MTDSTRPYPPALEVCGRCQHRSENHRLLACGNEAPDFVAVERTQLCRFKPSRFESDAPPRRRRGRRLNMPQPLRPLDREGALEAAQKGLSAGRFVSVATSPASFMVLRMDEEAAAVVQQQMQDAGLGLGAIDPGEPLDQVETLRAISDGMDAGQCCAAHPHRGGYVVLRFPPEVAMALGIRAQQAGLLSDPRAEPGLMGFDGAGPPPGRPPTDLPPELLEGLEGGWCPPGEAPELEDLEDGKTDAGVQSTREEWHNPDGGTCSDCLHFPVCERFVVLGLFPRPKPYPPTFPQSPACLFTEGLYTPGRGETNATEDPECCVPEGP